MRRVFWFALLLSSSLAIGQNCTTYTVVNALDHKSLDDIENLKADDFVANLGDAPVAVVSATQDFNNRVLVLLETDGTKSEKIEEVVSLATRLARQAPDGKPLAFGIFAKRSLFTKGFNTDSKTRAAEISAVIEDAPTLGKRVALYDALHNALAVFGAHQPGDTIVLISDGFDDNSSHLGASQIEKELAAKGTRLLVELRQQPSHVTGNFTWRPPEQDRAILERMSARSGGAYTMFSAHLFAFPWRGYMLGVSIPEDSHHSRKWKLRLGDTVALSHKRTNLYYPERLPGCTSTVSAAAR
jgi:hypothetical protein